MFSDYYTYVYLDPRKPGDFTYDKFHFDYEPFYVGKGRQDRKFVHLWEAKAPKSWNGCHPNKYKRSKIRKILKAGLEPIIYLAGEALEEETALFLEVELVKVIGRKIDGGPLTNIAPGGEAGATDWKNPAKGKTFEQAFGEEKAKEARRKMSEAIRRQMKDPDYFKKRKEIVARSVQTRSQNPEWKKKQVEVMRSIHTPENFLKSGKTLHENYRAGKYPKAKEANQLNGKLNVGVTSTAWKGWFYNPENDSSYDTRKTAAKDMKCSTETIMNYVRQGKWLLLPEPRGKIILGDYPPKEEFLRRGGLPKNIKKWVYQD